MSVEETLQKRLVDEILKPEYANKTREQAFAFLNAVEEVSTETKLREILLDDLIEMLSPESAAKIFAWPMQGDLRDKVAAQDHASVIKWVYFLEKAGAISPGEFSEAYGYLTRTQQVQVTTPIQSRVWDVIRAIPNGPNAVTTEQFAAAWTVAGRS